MLRRSTEDADRDEEEANQSALRIQKKLLAMIREEEAYMIHSLTSYAKQSPLVGVSGLLDVCRTTLCESVGDLYCIVEEINRGRRQGRRGGESVGFTDTEKTPGHDKRRGSIYDPLADQLRQAESFVDEVVHRSAPLLHRQGATGRGVDETMVLQPLEDIRVVYDSRRGIHLCTHIEKDKLSTRGAGSVGAVQHDLAGWQTDGIIDGAFKTPRSSTKQSKSTRTSTRVVSQDNQTSNIPILSSDNMQFPPQRGFITPIRSGIMSSSTSNNFGLISPMGSSLRQHSSTSRSIPSMPYLPSPYLSSQLPIDAIQVCMKHSHVHFTTPEVRSISMSIQQALDELLIMVDTVLGNLFESIKPYMPSLHALCNAVSFLDMICSLSSYVALQPFSSIPIFTQAHTPLALRNCIHPLLSGTIIGIEPSSDRSHQFGQKRTKHHSRPLSHRNSSNNGKEKEKEKEKERYKEGSVREEESESSGNDVGDLDRCMSNHRGIGSFPMSHPSLSSSTASTQVSGFNHIVPNDVFVAPSCSVQLIYGANGSGKTTYTTLVLLLIVLAHIGCHVPAQFCSLPLFAS
ncbi:DNA mismatch repair MutS family like protein, partial [Aduncisulcus paluster]